MAGRVIVSENSRTALTLTPNNVQAKKFPQYLAAILATLAAMVGGSFMSWTSSALPLLQEPCSVPHITDEEGSWIGSLLNLGAFVGALPAGLVADRIGRRTTLCVLALPLVTSWLLIAFSGSVAQLFVGRFLGGFAVGAVSVAAPTYIAELAESSIRGALGTLFQLQITIGVLFGYLAGMVGDPRALSLTCCALPVLFLVTFFCMPESPVFLLSKNRKDDAKKALQWFRGKDYDVEDELTKMLDTIQEAERNKASLGDLLSSRGTVRALIVSLGLMTFQQMSGVNAVIFYSGKIFEASGSSMSPTTASIVIGIVQVLATYVSSLLIDRAGRRILLLISSSVMGLCLSILALYFYLQVQEYDVRSISWLPLGSVSIFIIVFSVGFGPIPWIMFGELFPNNVKGVASAITASFNWILAFTVTKVFQNMLDLLGSPVTFCIFSAMCVTGTIFTAILVPETKGKDLKEIQLELSGEKSTRELESVVSDSRKITLSYTKPV
ncbi:facilitated trehalose transporter Tret1-like [Periplaneta americana]|uniref:facilitated trehalose transporter Tret1-like n=1 Tax=Periplaneta americana TaxID=6978 RepID=UPI0037E8190D